MGVLFVEVKEEGGSPTGMSTEALGRATEREKAMQRQDAEVRGARAMFDRGSWWVVAPVRRPLEICDTVGWCDEPSAFQVQAAALERNGMESLLFDMRSAPNKKHGQLLNR